MAKAKAEEKEGEAAEKEDKKDDKKNKKDAKKEDEKKGAEEKGDAPEGEGEEAAEGEGASKKSKKKVIIIGAVALVLLLGGAAGTYFTLFHKHEETKAEAGLGPDGKPITKAVYYTLPEFLVNLNAGGKATSFLKTTVILELTQQADVPLVEANMPRLQDSFNTYLRELRASDLSGSAGIERLREELLLRANKALAPVKVNAVLFKEIIVQ